MQNLKKENGKNPLITIYYEAVAVSLWAVSSRMNTIASRDQIKPIKTGENFVVNSKKLWKHSPAARVPTAFLGLPNFHSSFYNSIETRYMFSIS